MGFVSVSEAVKDLKNGKMLVMVDAEERENEGDLIFAAQFSTPALVNFAITHARGVLCVALNERIAHDLELPLMVAHNTSTHETAFTITCDAADAATGVSAFERDKTIQILADPRSKPEMLVRPGHINPLIARNGGVLERTGHTEGVVDLCRLAQLREACVICEIVKEDGNMARRSDLLGFCDKFGLNMIAVSDIITHRLKNESLIKLVVENSSNIAGFAARKLIFADHNGAKHIVFVFGELKKSENVKFHISGSDFDLLTSQKFGTLLEQIEFLSRNGGVLICMQGEKSTKIQFKSYGIGAQILRHLSIEEVRLLEKSEKDFVALEGFGLKLGFL